jgi:hypothetical protein
MAASTATIDPRPSVFGDRLIVTGSFTAGDTGTLSIDLSSQFASIDMAFANFTGALSPVTIEDTSAVPPTQQLHVNPVCNIDGTTLRIASGLDAYPFIGGKFFAIGRRS